MFDGAPLPAKRVTESSREQSRSEAFRKALELEHQGQMFLAKASFAKSVDVTPQMAYDVACALKPLGVNVVVAPYEADAQLAYLSRNGLVDVVISEDSDLLVYGCKRVLYKLDPKTEKGQEIRYQDVFSCTQFSRLTADTFLLAAVLSGCDYVPSLDKIGIKSAIALAAKAEGLLSRSGISVTSLEFLKKLKMLIRLSGIPDEVIGDDFVGNVRMALWTFKHQVVFNTQERRLQHLTPIDSEIEDISFMGEMYDDQTACAVADCLVDPGTKAIFVATKRTAPPDPKPKPLKPKRIPKPVPVNTGGMRTLAACWAYRIPVPDEMTSEFADPVIEISDSELSLTPPEIVTRFGIDDLDRFSAIVSESRKSKRSRTENNTVCDADSIENFSFDNYRN